MQLYYSPIIENDIAILDTMDAVHVTKSMRKKLGDAIFITDGRGRKMRAEIIELKPDIKLRILESFPVEKPKYELHLAAAILKKPQKTEWMLEKCIEFGLTSFTPIRTKYTEKQNIRLERLEKIALSAMKQSLKVFKTGINEVSSFEDLINQETQAKKYIAHCNTDFSRQPLNSVDFNNSKMLVLIGPEGGFHPSEIDHAMDAGFRGIDLGSSRLRAETAGLAISSFLSLS